MIDFAAIQGPRGSREANFAQLVGEVLARERKAFTLDGAGGDEGIDSYATDETGVLTIFQAKYFRGRISSSRRSQIRRSFDIAQRHPKPFRWILCTPVDPTPAEGRWLQSLAIGKDTTVEWWGETYLRSLISRHVDLVAAFFPEQRILSELKTIRQELGSYHAIVSAKASFLRYGESVEGVYLREAAELSRLLHEDRPLAEKPGGGSLVVIDFSELYRYMATVPTLVLARPIVDYCIETSPAPLTLAPGGTLHLHRLTKAIAYDTPPWRAIRNFEQELLAMRDAFVSSYESDPKGKATARAYNQLMHAVAPSEHLTYSGLQRLTKLFRSGRLRPWSRATPPGDELLFKIHHRLEMIRQGRSFANLASSIDLRAIIEARESGESSVTVVTSAPYFRLIAADIFANDSPIRSTRQYGQLLYLAELSRTGVDWTGILDTLGDVIDGMQRILPGLDAFLDGSSLLSHKEVEVLERFAKCYRILLRPVDQMVESGFQAVNRSALASMTELYRALSSEAELTAAFRVWWERLCMAAAELQEYLTDNYDTDELTTLFASVRGKEVK